MSAALNLRRDCPTFFDTMASALIEQSKATPYFHLEGYMERWWLQRPAGHGEQSDVSDRNQTGHAARVHHILRSDSDRAFHCHPWPSTSIILLGGYWELLPLDQAQHPCSDAKYHRKLWREPGDVVQREATDRHRIILPEGQTAWSLFLMGDYEKSWFFHDAVRGKVPWREYLGEESRSVTETDKHWGDVHEGKTA